MDPAAITSWVVTLELATAVAVSKLYASVVSVGTMATEFVSAYLKYLGKGFKSGWALLQHTIYTRN